MRFACFALYLFAWFIARHLLQRGALIFGIGQHGSQRGAIWCGSLQRIG
jgi:hypothetical protein